MLELPNLQEWFRLLVELNTSGTQNACLLANDDDDDAKQSKHKSCFA
jgi:hypothetical protein